MTVTHALTHWERVFLTNAFSLPCTFLLLLGSNETARLPELVAGLRHRPLHWVLASCVLGVGISFSGWSLRDKLTATAFSLVGVACKVGSILFSQLAFHDGTAGGTAALVLVLARPPPPPPAPAPRAVAVLTRARARVPWDLTGGVVPVRARGVLRARRLLRRSREAAARPRGCAEKQLAVQVAATVAQVGRGGGGQAVDGRRGGKSVDVTFLDLPLILTENDFSTNLQTSRGLTRAHDVSLNVPPFNGFPGSILGTCSINRKKLCSLPPASQPRPRTGAVGVGFRNPAHTTTVCKNLALAAALQRGRLAVCGETPGARRRARCPCPSP